MSRIQSIVLSTLCSWSIPLASITIAQVLPDQSLPVNSRVITNGSQILVDDGTVRGRNVFHSFERLDLNSGEFLRFLNINAENIFARITGGRSSNLNGQIRVDGLANLFLINSNGISFGRDASLLLNGSFLATTGNSIDFGDGAVFRSTLRGDASSFSSAIPVSIQFKLAARRPGLRSGSKRQNFPINPIEIPRSI